VKEADKKAPKEEAAVDKAAADESKKAAGDAGRALEAMADLFEEKEEPAVAGEAGAVDEAAKQPEEAKLEVAAGLPAVAEKKDEEGVPEVEVNAADKDENKVEQ